jgi:hypothetical protein
MVQETKQVVRTKPAAENSIKSRLVLIREISGENTAEKTELPLVETGSHEENRRSVRREHHVSDMANVGN